MNIDMAIRIKDIASALNISSATVSLVLNNKPGVKKDTREKVLDYISQNGYSTNALMKPGLDILGDLQMVIYKKSGKVVSDTPFFSRLIEGIESESRKSGYQLMISYVDETDEGAGILRRIRENPPTGIILLATEMTSDDLKKFNDINVPLVLLDNHFENMDMDMVVIDNERGAYIATEHLIDMGHREIGYLHSSFKINNFEERSKGFQKALSDHQIELKQDYIIPLDSTQNGAYNDMKAVLNQNPKLPTAVFADNDLIALGAYKALKEYGCEIPRDISLVGFDNMPFCTMAIPALSSVRVHNQKMGMVAVQRLIDKIENSSEEIQKIIVGVNLIKRESVKNISESKKESS